MLFLLENGNVTKVINCFNKATVFKLLLTHLTQIYN